ncbi:MAG TPA: DNA internalization-related competence protein ComEC/Rec2 [Rheinheimera sp.]|nr:DNA internalization-related competence protein ComEC/Rec2 [Rheinheimera sp.]
MDRFCLLVVLSVVICLGVSTIPTSLQLGGALCVTLGLLSSCLVVTCSGVNHQLSSKVLQGCHALQVCLLCVTALLLYPFQLSTQLEHDAQLFQRVDSQPRAVLGEIVGLPKNSGAGWQFFFKTTTAQLGLSTAMESVLIDVRWYLPLVPDYGDVAADLQLPSLKEGQIWQLELSIKPVIATANPSQGWREGNLWLQGVLFSGQVRYRQQSTPAGITLLAQATQLQGAVSWRQQIADGFARCCASYTAYPLWLALTVGERPFSAQLWQGLRNAGLNHILSISGMHIALVFQWCLLLGYLIRWLPMGESLRVLLLWSCAGMVATGYAWLAGFAIPTQRALWTLLLLIVLGILRRRASSWSMHLLLTALMLLAWPALLVSVSFWFTVAALTLLIAMQWLQVKPAHWRGYLTAFFKAQLWFSVGLLPLSLWFFHGIAPWALLINLLLVPYIALLLFPALCLVAALQVLSSVWNISWMPQAWQLLDWLFTPLWQVLVALDGDNAWWSLPELEMPEIALICLLLYCACWWSHWHRWCSICIVLVLLWCGSDVTEPRVHIIDVGQGSATLLQVGRHGALLDAGPALGDWSATEQIILPYLQYYRINQLDWVLLSHDDADHTGNLQVLRQRYPALQLYADFRSDAKPCQQLPHRWQGFDLQMLWPKNQQHSDNESSCVVSVKHQQMQWLVPGDLGAAEHTLLAKQPDLRTHVLVLGHHGSKNSSSIGWLQQLKPTIALASAGRLNRFGHPSIDVQARLQLLQIPLLSTADDGAIVFTQQGAGWHYQAYRQQRYPRWLEKLSQDAVSQHRNR